ncbi:MAG: cysteine-rich CWC family protein [Bacteroidetes bacterium]|nr:cysteine-rich CWC family protein [Bacteroidota bacterium]
MPIKKCVKCSQDFHCGAEKRGCWCERYNLSSSTLDKLRQQYDNCLCESCIRAYAMQQNAANSEGLPINS